MTTNRSSARVRFRGRLWLAIYLWIMFVALLALTGATFFLGWAAVPIMGIPCLLIAYICLTMGWGEAVARVDMDDQGISLRLPTYRGFWPFWPTQRLKAAWPEVREIRARSVSGRYFALPLNYVVYRIIAEHGEASFVTPAPGGAFMSNPRGSTQNLPVPDIVAAISAHTHHFVRNDGRTKGAGLVRSIFFGASEQPIQAPK